MRFYEALFRKREIKISLIVFIKKLFNRNRRFEVELLSVPQLLVVSTLQISILLLIVESSLLIVASN